MNLSELPQTSATPDSRGGIHTVTWKDAGLKVTVSKLREQSNGDLRADFDLTCQLLPPEPPFKYFSRFNFKSGQTKASTAKDLARVSEGRIFAGEAVWRYIVERVCDEARVAFNKGEQGVELVDSKASTTTNFRLWPFLQEKQPTVLFGPGDSGKSFFGVLGASPSIV